MYSLISSTESVEKHIGGSSLLSIKARLFFAPVFIDLVHQKRSLGPVIFSSIKGSLASILTLSRFQMIVKWRGLGHS